MNKIIEVALKYIGQKEPDFIETVFKEVFPELSDLFSKSAIQTYQNFQQAGGYVTDSLKQGSIIVWVDPQPEGRLGIIYEVKADEFTSIEMGDNGIEIKSNKITENDLTILGFIQI